MLILQFGEVNYFYLHKTFEELQFSRRGDFSLHKTRENNVTASPAPAQNIRDREPGQRYDLDTSSLCHYILWMFQLVSKIMNLCWQLEENALLSITL